MQVEKFVDFLMKGYGKVRLQSSDAVADFKSLAALHGDYITAEVM